MTKKRSSEIFGGKREILVREKKFPSPQTRRQVSANVHERNGDRLVAWEEGNASTGDVCFNTVVRKKYKRPTWRKWRYSVYPHSRPTAPLVM